ncbi:MAG: rod shape-determining protein MreC [Alphaproteobacteria bacterium]|jgi:rod shape-determining protein MreC|nr:rod shape-determining protein MreC [Alphaproteobacteria bacterium]
MLLSLLGLKATGLRRRHIFFVFMARTFKRSVIAINKFFFTILFVAMSAYCLHLSSIQHPIFSSLESMLMDITTPAIHFLSQPIEWTKEYIRNNESLRQEINKLREENKKLLDWQVLAQKKERENQYLKEMLNTDPNLPNSIVTTKILGIPNDGYRATMLVANSSSLELERNQAVVCPDGIIGRIINIGMTTARVMLITDLNSRVPVRVESTGEQAILSGHNNSRELTVIHTDSTASSDLQPSVKKEPIKVGDRFLTSGYGGIYPPGLPVAVVTNIQNETITATIIADVTRLEYVTILKNAVPEDVE